MWTFQDHWDERGEASADVQAVPEDHRGHGAPRQARAHTHTPGGATLYVTMWIWIMESSNIWAKIMTWLYLLDII